MKKENYLNEIRLAVGVNVNRCYQCGKCSAGCALNDEMDYPPSMIMRMLQTKEESNYLSVLQSQSIWLCVSCQNCVTRCPMEINIPGLMDYLREKSLAQKTVNPKSENILSFHKSFLDSIKYTGRLYEIGLVVGYKLRSGKLMQDLTLAPAMLAKGKLPLIPEQVKEKEQMKDIFKKTNV